MEIASKQHELDQFSTKGKQLVMELKKIPDCDADIIKKDMDTLVDQWLDVSPTSGFPTIVLCCLDVPVPMETLYAKIENRK